MRPLITAHAGCERTEPNTINSLEHAFNCGADIAEVDVRCSADGTPVLSHDDIFSENAISETSLINLPGIVPLKDALVFAVKNHYFLNLDIKDFSAIDFVYRDIEKTGSFRNIILSGCTPDQTRDIRARYPSLRTMVNVSKNFIPDSLLSRHAADPELFINTLADIYTSIGCMCLNISLDLCNENLIEQLRKNCVPLSIWTVDDPASAVSLADRGAYSITTNAVCDTVRALKRQPVMS